MPRASCAPLPASAEISARRTRKSPSLPQAQIVSDYCIATDDEVASVCLFSQVPLESIESVYLDYQSRSSVALLKLLLKNYWKINPALLDAQEGFESQIQGTAAGLVIGDRALEQRSHAAYIYDLGTAWKSYTKLPFVFAAWVANKKLPADILGRFNEATGAGLQHIKEIADAQDFKAYDLNKYYTKNINFLLTDDKRKGLALFLEKLSSDQ